LSPNDTRGRGGQPKCHVSFFRPFFELKSLIKVMFPEEQKLSCHTGGGGGS